jgi:hypothetical protein
MTFVIFRMQAGWPQSRSGRGNKTRNNCLCVVLNLRRQMLTLTVVLTFADCHALNCMTLNELPSVRRWENKQACNQKLSRLTAVNVRTVLGVELCQVRI